MSEIDGYIFCDHKVLNLIYNTFACISTLVARRPLFIGSIRGLCSHNPLIPGSSPGGPPEKHTLISSGWGFVSTETIVNPNTSYSSTWIAGQAPVIQI